MFFKLLLHISFILNPTDKGKKDLNSIFSLFMLLEMHSF
jgi:hypothetical protein